MLKRLITIEGAESLPKEAQRDLNEELRGLVIHYCETYCENPAATFGDKCLVAGHQECPGICDGEGWFINVGY